VTIDDLADRMRIWNVVYRTSVVALFEDEVSIVEHIRKKSMTLDVNLDNTLSIDQLNIVYEKEGCMDDDDRIWAHEDDMSIEVDRTEDNTYEYIVDGDDDRGDDDIVAHVSREQLSI
jgi:hypothetical protein